MGQVSRNMLGKTFKIACLSISLFLSTSCTSEVLLFIPFANSSTQLFATDKILNTDIPVRLEFINENNETIQLDTVLSNLVLKNNGGLSLPSNLSRVKLTSLLNNESIPLLDIDQKIPEKEEEIFKLLNDLLKDNEKVKEILKPELEPQIPKGKVLDETEFVEGEVKKIIKTITLPSPLKLKVEQVTRSSATFSWTPPSYDDIKGYRLYLGQDKVLDLTANLQYKISNLSPDSPYLFSVTTIDNRDNESLPEGILFNTLPLAQPIGMKVISVSETEVSVTWDPPEDESFTGYNLYVDNELVKSDHPVGSYKFTQLEPDTIYFFSVSTVTDAGESERKLSNIEAKTLAAPPPNTNAPVNPTAGTPPVAPTPPSVPLSPPGITSITPGSGISGATITINGSDFGATPSVDFNGVSATVLSSNGTQIQVLVPVGATTGPVKVVTSGGSDTSGPFTVINNAPPVISNVTASISTVSGLAFPVELTCNATDADDTLTATSYTWSTDGGSFGSFSSLNGSQVFWTAPSGAGGPYTLRCSVNDGINPAVEQTINVGVDNGMTSVTVNGGFSS